MPRDTNQALAGSIRDIQDAILSAFISQNVSDSNGESANVVDALDNIAKAIRHLGDCVKGSKCPPSP